MVALQVGTRRNMNAGIRLYNCHKLAFELDLFERCKNFTSRREVFAVDHNII